MIKTRFFPFIIFYSLFFLSVLTINYGINSISMISYLLIVITSVFSKERDDVAILFCLIPIQRVFMLSRGFMTTVPIISIIVIVKHIFNYGFNKSTLEQVIIILILLLYSSLVEFVRFSTTTKSMEYILTILLMLVVSQLVDNKLRLTCFSLFCLNALLSSLIGFVAPSVSRYTALFTMEFNPRFQGLMADPGEFALSMICAISMSFSIYSCLSHNSKFTKYNSFFAIVLVLYCLILFYFLVLSGTRASLISLAVIFVVLLCRALKSKNNIIRFIGFLCGFGSIFVVGLAGPKLYDLFLTMHGETSLADDNRFVIWSSYLDAILKNPDILLFGVGMNSCSAYGTMMSIGNPHNVILEKVVEAGLIGVALNFPIFYTLIKQKNMSLFKLDDLPFYAFLAALMVYGVSGFELPYLLLALLPNKNKSLDERASKGHGMTLSSFHQIN